MKTISDEKGYWIELESPQEKNKAGIGEIRPEIMELILELKDIFGEPQRLPPKRNCDHSIRLIQGA